MVDEVEKRKKLARYVERERGREREKGGGGEFLGNNFEGGKQQL